MSDREVHCAAKWMEALIDQEDADLGEYWREEGLKAKEIRLFPFVPPKEGRRR
jgi:hypothetical protein